MGEVTPGKKSGRWYQDPVRRSPHCNAQCDAQYDECDACRAAMLNAMPSTVLAECAECAHLVSQLVRAFAVLIRTPELVGLALRPRQMRRRVAARYTRHEPRRRRAAAPTDAASRTAATTAAVWGVVWLHRLDLVQAAAAAAGVAHAAAAVRKPAACAGAGARAVSSVHRRACARRRRARARPERLHLRVLLLQQQPAAISQACQLLLQLHAPEGPAHTYHVCVVRCAGRRGEGNTVNPGPGLVDSACCKDCALPADAAASACGN
eukprot:364215-Chlamydomonas_euryale.AAC.2